MIRFKNKFFTEYLPIVATFIFIVVFAIIFKQKFIKTLPLCVSLLIMLLNSHANRIGFLLGAINSFIYVIGYLSEGLYGTVASATFGAIIQLITFFRWKKHAYKQATQFKKFSFRGFLLMITSILFCWAMVSVVLWQMDGTEYVLEGFTTTLGFILPIIIMFAYIEAPFMNVISQSVSLVIWIRIVVTSGNVANLTYMIYTTYCIYMIFRQGLIWIKLYKEQKEKIINGENFQ